MEAFPMRTVPVRSASAGVDDAYLSVDVGSRYSVIGGE